MSDKYAIFQRLTKSDRVRLAQSSEAAEQIENHWDRVLEEAIGRQVGKTIEALERGQPFPEPNFERIMVEHYFQTIFQAYKVAEQGWEFEKKRLAKPPAPKTPRSLRELMAMYDLWRSQGIKPNKRVKAQADVIKKAYLEKVRDVFERASEPFRTGEVFNRDQAVADIKRAASTTYSRAAMIVRTETTTYYNEGRKTFYDQSQDVTHYLFLAVRDAATSAWCSPGKTNGKRGRHGLVYKKEDPLLARETPACHPHCRSEILPLTADNPAHAALIEDSSIQRRNVQCYPLIKGWGR